ncbi:cytochrome c1 [Neoehrlichia mikurensis]|uniref:Cytochrome c1 n=1 Tax=Neoehrlichia mikurensis TaxID=89586 RepID=A0A9Q9BZW0_9RICK|nr:cytochrome c1 [Neoehrlichia mikurensis]QXK91884.1 cytochrome c1 [Neoehrlichia mikurensis]QXK93097.1 cytochrome c1 [Neoehrlichia mikurensis]QXK93577.1 cytochrome c1 [Neoehrlichia mikurensis]UTO55470.1 cytochrome c1 [Neoehrlichia mikurensis]UTO56390.1 cytochrome c1 [Neoehrlichia mikurensis]
MFIRLLVLFIVVLLCWNTYSEEFHAERPISQTWKFNGILGSFDKRSIQRGYKVYKEVCAACHSMKRIAFRNLREIGFSEEEIKSIASSYQIKDGPNDAGEMFERPGVPSDYFPSPFSNKEAAMASNNGAYPPDLSLIIKAKHDGANYVYSLLNGYKSTNPDINGLYENIYFATGKILMPPPLFDNAVKYTDGTESTVSNMAYDVVNFLHWAAEPEMEIRKRLGLKVVICLMIVTVFIVLINRKLWSKLYK